MAWFICGPPIRRISGALPIWECWQRPRSIRCSLRTTPTSTGFGACGQSMAGHANPANDRWLNQQAFYFYDQAQTWIGIVPSQMVDSEKSLSYRYQPPQWPPGAVVVAAAPTALADNARPARSGDATQCAARRAQYRNRDEGASGASHDAADRGARRRRDSASRRWSREPPRPPWCCASTAWKSPPIAAPWSKFSSTGPT